MIDPQSLKPCPCCGSVARLLEVPRCTLADCERILTLNEKATIGEWTFEVNDYSPSYVRCGARIIAHVVGDRAETEDNSYFIAAARNSAPEMARALMVAMAFIRKNHPSCDDVSFSGPNCESCKLLRAFYGEDA